MDHKDNENNTVVLLGSLGVSYEKWLPYATGCLISHCLNSPSLRGFEFRPPLYKNLSRDILEAQLDGVDILGLTCYSWNQNVNEYYTQVFRQIRPDGIVVWGGPNVPKKHDQLKYFAKSHPYVDHFVTGIGEAAFHNLLLRLQNGGRDSIKGEIIIDGSHSMLPPHKGNPYLDGVFEEIIQSDRNLKASFESNRGCPYQCSFCDWGGQAGSRIEAIGMDEVERVIDYIYSKPNIREVEILDANFGMFRRDREIIDLMVHYREKHGNQPNVSYSGLAKNGSPFLPDIIRTIENKLNSKKHQLKISFQSHSEETLRTNHRENIKNEKLIRLMTDLRENGQPEVASELIIGLPGDTPLKFLQTLSTDVALGISNSRAYILSVSENTTLKDSHFVRQHGLKFKTVRFPRTYSSWPRIWLLDPKKWPPLAPSDSFEEHQLVFQSNTMNLKNLKTTFLYWWFHHSFYNTGGLSRTLRHLNEIGHSYSEWMDSFLKEAQSHPVLSRQMSRIEKTIEQVFSPEPLTTLLDFTTYTFMSGPLRTTEVHEILNHSQSIQMFLQKFFMSAEFPASVHETLRSDFSNWRTLDREKEDSHLGLLARLDVSPVVHGHSMKESF